MILTTRLQLAINDSLIYHETQKRKGTNIPYATHPLTIALILVDVGMAEDIIIGALLHDTLEDTTMKPETIKEKYGERVLSLVQACSEEDQSKPWEVRKQHTIDKLENLSIEASWIIFADKLHNLFSMHYVYQTEGDCLWKVFSRGYDKQKWYYSQLLNAFSKKECLKNHELFMMFKRLHEELFKDES